MNTQLFCFIIFISILLLFTLYYFSVESRQFNYHKKAFDREYLKPEHNFKVKIPKVVMQTSKNQLSKFYIDALKLKIDGYEYQHFTDEDIYKFFEENQDPEFPNIANVFKQVKLGEHKADLFRYYYLYKKGGVYLDSDLMIYKHMDDILKEYEFIAMNNKLENHITNAFLASSPNNPIIYNALKKYLESDYKNFHKGRYTVVCKQLKQSIDSVHFENKYLYREYQSMKDFATNCFDDEMDGKLVIKHMWNDIVPMKFLFNDKKSSKHSRKIL